ncbi:MAG: antitoxin [Pseudonocardiaceae bacterium]|nr:antitoxin [Pseudonocardiaceae bacterium]
MRTTIDLPDDLHKVAMSIARDTSRSLSETVTELVRRGLRSGPASEVSSKVRRHPVTGFPTLRLGQTITTEDVRSLEDDE